VLAAVLFLDVVELGAVVAGQGVEVEWGSWPASARARLHQISAHSRDR
jgi:hypothetical protein